MAHAAVYTWQGHDLCFEVPDGGFLAYSSNSRLEMQWEDMVITMVLYTKDDATDKVIRENLQRKALGYNMYDLQMGKMKVKGFKAFDIEGTMPDGSRAIIADLVSKKQNLVVEVTVNYLYGNREVVEDVIKSVTEGSKQPNKQKHRQRVQSKEDAKRQKEQPKQEPKPKVDDGPLYDC